MSIPGHVVTDHCPVTKNVWQALLRFPIISASSVCFCMLFLNAQTLCTIKLFVVFSLFENPVFISSTKTLLFSRFANISSHSAGYLLTFLTTTYKICSCFGVMSKNLLPNPRSWRFHLAFFLFLIFLLFEKKKKAAQRSVSLFESWSDTEKAGRDKKRER